MLTRLISQCTHPPFTINLMHPHSFAAACSNSCLDHLMDLCSSYAEFRQTLPRCLGVTAVGQPLMDGSIVSYFCYSQEVCSLGTYLLSKDIRRVSCSQRKSPTKSTLYLKIKKNNNLKVCYRCVQKDYVFQCCMWSKPRWKPASFPQ